MLQKPVNAAVSPSPLRLNATVVVKVPVYGPDGPADGPKKGHRHKERQEPLVRRKPRVPHSR